MHRRRNQTIRQDFRKMNRQSPSPAGGYHVGLLPPWLRCYSYVSPLVDLVFRSVFQSDCDHAAGLLIRASHFSRTARTGCPDGRRSLKPLVRSMISSSMFLGGKDQIALHSDAHPFCRLSGLDHVPAGNMAGERKLQDLECLQGFSILATKERCRKAH